MISLTSTIQHNYSKVSGRMNARKIDYCGRRAPRSDVFQRPCMYWRTLFPQKTAGITRPPRTNVKLHKSTVGAITDLAFIQIMIPLPMPKLTRFAIKPFPGSGSNGSPSTRGRNPYDHRCWELLHLPIRVVERLDHCLRQHSAHNHYTG